MSKKRKIRSMRSSIRENSDGTVSSHKMVWTGDPSKKRGNFGVYPSISPKNGKEGSSAPADWKEQSVEEAKEKGEFISVKRKEKAERLSAGSWKKGRDKREAMRAYRERRKK